MALEIVVAADLRGFGGENGGDGENGRDGGGC